MIFKGSCTAMITPFTKNGEKIDYEALKKQIDFQIENGTSALLFLGTTGEPPTLSDEEQLELAKFAISYVNKRVPVILGAGSNNTAVAVKKSKQFEKLGADALLHVTPYYNKCTQKGLIEHYTQIAKQTSLPIILYNVPARTGVNILPQTVKELSKISNIVAIKEASGNIEAVMEIARLCPNFTIYSGDDGIVVPILSVGAKGVVSVASNIIPKKMSDLCKAFFKNNICSAKNIQLKINPLIKALFSETNPIPVKTASALINKNSANFRLPLTKMNEKELKNLKKELKNLNLI